METKMNFNFWIPTRILFGTGELQNLHKQPMPGRKALLVISNGRSTRANSRPANFAGLPGGIFTENLK